LNRRFPRYILISFALGIVLAPPIAAADPKVPTRIISLSPSATEDLFSIGANKQVIAVDDNSNFPVGVPTSKLSSFNPNAEAISKYRPDLVIIQKSATKSAAITKQLRSLKIKVYVEKTPPNLDGVYQEISDLGALTNHTTEAQALIASIKSERSKAISKAKLKKLTFYHELDNTLYSATSSTFIGKVYSDFNLINVADAAAKADDGGYPKLQAEYLISANPKIIFLADAQYGETAKKVSARPGWGSISAVKNKKIVLLPADISSRWGPRIINFYQIVSNALS
jgi:iron complex transport system substrate-binding protein